MVFSDISAADYCGRRGSDYTSITLAVAPEDLSSIVTGVPYSLNVADLLCPPKSLTESHPWQDSPVSFLGQGYRPIISPPPELLSLDPTWGGCFVDPFQGNDPPRALTPVAAMDPATTRDAVSSVTSAIPSPAPPALPASTKPNEITNPLPTGKSDPPVQSDPASPPHPASSANPPQPSANSQNGDPQQSAAIKSDHKNPQSQNDPQAPEQGPLSLKNGDPQPTLSASTNAQPQPQPSIDPLLFIANPDIKAGHTVTIASGASRIAVGSQTLVLGGPAATISDIPVSLGVGGLVVGSQRGAPQGGPLADPSRATQVVTVNGEVISVGGGVAVMGGTTVSAGAPAITISGKVVSMGDGVLVVGTQTVALPSASSKGSSEWSPLVTVGNQVITAYPTGFAVSGTTLLPGHAGITVAGTPISLDPSGLLIVGTSTRTVGPLISAKPSGFIMDGTTLLPGQAGITISGTPILLNPLGLLVVGTSTLPPNAHITAYPTAFSIDGTTLRPGGPGLTLSGEVLTLESSGLLVVGSSTLSLDPSRSSDAVGLGGLILSGFGPIGGPTGSTTSSVQIFNGAQAKKNVPRIGGLLGLSGISVLGMLV